MVRLLVCACALLAISCSKTEFVIGHYLRDAGERDAGEAPTPDASSDATGPMPQVDECAATYADALVCSDFEDEPLRDEWSELIFMGESDLERTDARAHRGERSLRAESTAPKSRAAVVAKFPPLYEGELFLRAYVFVPESLPTDIMNVFFFGDDARRNDVFEGVDLNIQDSALQVFLPQHDPGRFTGEALIPRGAWFCFRAHVVLSNGEGSVDVYADDQLLVEVSGVDTVPDGGVREFRAGIDWSSEQDAFFEVFLDDVVVATSEVACL